MAVAGINLVATGAVVAAVTGKKIRVKSFEIYQGSVTPGTVKWQSGATDLTTVAALGPAVGPAGALQPDPAPQGFLFETVAGQALNLAITGSTLVGGWVEYTLE